LGIIFLYSGIQHVFRPHEFLASVSAYEMAAPNLNVFAASVLPWAEIAVGMGLISGLLSQGAVLVAVVLLAIYSGAIAFALSHHLQIDCGCFDLGNNASPITRMTFARTTTLFAIAVILFIHSVFGRPIAIRRGESAIQAPKIVTQ